MTKYIEYLALWIAVQLHMTLLLYIMYNNNIMWACIQAYTHAHKRNNYAHNISHLLYFCIRPINLIIWALRGTRPIWFIFCPLEIIIVTFLIMFSHTEHK